MFRILSVTSPRCKLQLRGTSTKSNCERNIISVLTGPNGSGKTELLTTLADWYFNPDDRSFHTNVIADGDVHTVPGSAVGRILPSRVIAQTFSPFSRFAAPKVSELTLTDIYRYGNKNEELYRSVGINRQSRQAGSTLAKRTLEQGIFRMTEEPEQARALRHVLATLGFHEQIGLSYRRYPAGQQLLQAFFEDRLYPYLLQIARAIDKRPSNALEKEIIRSNAESLFGLLDVALNLLRDHLRKPTIEFTFDFASGRASEDYSIMQALTLLRRLSLLRLDGCYLSSRSADGPVELANASSGQQQMLCSLFGLLSELTSHSLILIDEPELSLHPSWQMDFLTRLTTILEPFEGCHVIVATHSPLIVQSALLRGLEVVQLRPDHDGSPADTLPQQDGHTSVESALLDVFGTPVPESPYLANEIFQIVTDGEGGDDIARQAALARLHILRKLYERNEGLPVSAEDLDIIDTAIRLVNEPDDGTGDDGDDGDDA